MATGQNKRKKKKKKKRKAKAFVQTPWLFWEGQPWDLELCPTQFISVSPGPGVPGRTRVAELLQLHRPADLQAEPFCWLCPRWRRFGCRGSCYRAAARALLCNARLRCSLAPGWLRTTGETLVIPVLEAEPILTAVEGSARINWIPARRLCKKSKQLLLSSLLLWLFYSFGHGQG